MRTYSTLGCLALLLVGCGGAGEPAPPSGSGSAPAPASGAAAGTAGGGPTEQWSGTFGGAAPGDYSGPTAIATVNPNGVTQVQLYTADNARPYVAVTIMPFADPVAANSSGDVSVEAIFANSADLYSAISSGDATSLESGRPGDERFPDPARLVIESVTAQAVIGSVTAEMWQAKPDGDPSMRAQGMVSFTARACHRGTPNFGACTNPKNSWPPTGGSR